jgi:deazaflavin-dependent oxidoreductase (nitroreductase family)
MNQPAQREELLNRLKQSNEVNITVTGRKTKKRLSAPVWFVLDNEKVTFVPVRGSDNNWFKNLLKNPQIELGVGDIVIPFKATIVRDPNRVEMVLDRLRTKYGSMWSESHYTNRDVYVEVPL